MDSVDRVAAGDNRERNMRWGGMADAAAVADPRQWVVGHERAKEDNGSLSPIAKRPRRPQAHGHRGSPSRPGTPFQPTLIRRVPGKAWTYLVERARILDRRQITRIASFGERLDRPTQELA